METLQMKTAPDQVVPSITRAAFTPNLNREPVTPSAEFSEKRKEFVSWAACFAVVAALTGLLKLLGIGVTMESITNGLFYLSVAALVYFIVRIKMLSGESIQRAIPVTHELN